MEALTDIDVKILKYIDKCGSASINLIKKKFSNVSAIEYRIKNLSTPEYSHIPNVPVSIPIANTSYLRESVESTVDGKGHRHVKHLGIYELTERGKKELQNYTQEKSSAKKELWLKNAWIPILVTMATNLLISGIKWLLPLIRQWLSNAP